MQGVCWDTDSVEGEVSERGRIGETWRRLWAGGGKKFCKDGERNLPGQAIIGKGARWLARFTTVCRPGNFQVLLGVDEFFQEMVGAEFELIDVQEAEEVPSHISHIT